MAPPIVAFFSRRGYAKEPLNAPPRSKSLRPRPGSSDCDRRTELEVPLDRPPKLLRGRQYGIK